MTLCEVMTTQPTRHERNVIIYGEAINNQCFLPIIVLYTKKIKYKDNF